MSEIYNRTNGLMFNPDLVQREVADGTSGYDTPDVSLSEVPENDLSIQVNDTYNDRAFVLAYVQEDIDRAESEYEAAERRFEQSVANEKIAEGVTIIASRLKADYERRLSEGQPVDETYFSEAQDYAEIVAAANPDFSPADFTYATEALIELQYAERSLIALESELDQLLAA